MCLSPTLDKVGVLARTAQDCRLVSAAIAEAEDPQEARGVDGLTVGMAPDEFDAVAPTMRETGRRGLAELAALVGATVSMEISRDLPYGPAIETIISVDAADSLHELIWAHDTVLADPGQLVRLRAGAQVGEAEHAQAEEVRARAKDEFVRAFGEVDVIAALSQSAPPQRRDEPRQPRHTAAVSDRLLAAANLAGLPGVAVPCGLDDLGLPVSLHIVGPAGSDLTLLALADRFQQATPYHRLLPLEDA
jgi:aspartyl-tRNA(Asn)/glutamyl-tRNA(Gln) amidotransferase subunit A